MRKIKLREGERILHQMEQKKQEELNGLDGHRQRTSTVVTMRKTAHKVVDARANSIAH